MDPKNMINENETISPIFSSDQLIEIETKQVYNRKVKKISLSKIVNDVGETKSNPKLKIPIKFKFESSNTFPRTQTNSTSKRNMCSSVQQAAGKVRDFRQTSKTAVEVP